MSEIDDIFAAATEAERQEDAVENLTLSIQIALQKAMHANRVSQKQLAERLGLTPARVSQMLGGNSSNLTLKSIGRIAYALGEDFEFLRKVDADRLIAAPKRNVFDFEVGAPSRPKTMNWKEVTANTNNKIKTLAA